MRDKSTITTADAERLLSKGWRLTEHKCVFHGHSYYVHDESRMGLCGSAAYINRDVFDALVKRGHRPVRRTHA